MSLDLKDGAIFITDAHYPRCKDDFLALLDSLISSPPPQLFMLGDMFEFLCPVASYTIEANKEAIEKIEALANKTELIYLEGNHDFLLKTLFKKAYIAPISSQPLLLSSPIGNIALMHGDKYQKGLYPLYVKFIRNSFCIYLLRVLTIDINGRFIKKLYKKLSKKEICTHWPLFIQQKLSQIEKYPLKGVRTIIEGHNHIRISKQLKSFRYEALSAFACDKSFFKVEFNKGDISFKKFCLGAVQNEQA